MKKSLLNYTNWLIILLLFSCSGHDSFEYFNIHDNRNSTDMFPVQFDANSRLYYLCKIWGLNKYHTTNNISKVDIDGFLLNEMPKVIDSCSFHDFNKILERFINITTDLPEQINLSDLNECDSIRYYWIYNKQFIDSLNSIKLAYIVNLKASDKCMYVKKKRLGTVKFTNEQKYENVKFPNETYQLLALFRYWNAIEYFYPYKYNLRTDWNLILKQQIVEFRNCRSEQDYHEKVKRLVCFIDDSHSYAKSKLITQTFGKNMSNADIFFCDSGWIKIDDFTLNYKQNSELKAGDIILEIENQPIAKIVDSLGCFISASNRKSWYRDVSDFLLRSDKSTLNLKIIRRHQIINIVEPLIHIEKLKEKYLHEKRHFARLNNAKMPADGIGYLDVEKLYDGNIDMALDSLRKSTKGIIFDLRCYPHEQVGKKLIQKLINNDIAFARLYFPDMCSPGKFLLKKELETITAKGESYDNPIVVLVDENTQSKSEFLAMAFRSLSNVVLMGSQTAGADGNITTLYLPGNIKTVFSGVGVLYPNNEQTQRIGIVPDIIVDRTYYGILAGKDEVLEKAINYLKTVSEQ
ncbi:MAG: hypothetical protein JEZ09_02970 [Salinivirgaceae bacterium]|nr:hypothetical protein [Salinivirgaceae bacterium]